MFHSTRADSTITQKHSPHLLFFCIPVWSSWRPLHSRRMDDLCYPDPPHRSFSSRPHSFVHLFSIFHPPIIWLATFVSIVLRLEFVCTSSHSAHAAPTLALCLSIHPAGVLLGSGRSDNGSRTWLVLGIPLAVSVFPLSTTDERCAIRPNHSHRRSAHLVDGRSSTQYHPSASW